LAHPGGQIEQFVNSEDGSGPLKVSEESLATELLDE
jgi:hypothetical protein